MPAGRPRVPRLHGFNKSAGPNGRAVPECISINRRITACLTPEVWLNCCALPCPLPCIAAVEASLQSRSMQVLLKLTLESLPG
jgi:hypothetical protein